MSIDNEDIWGGRTFYFGRLAGREVVAAKTGVGKVFSAMTTQRLIDICKPECILFGGIAGSINPEYGIGDLVIARDCMQYDFDATRFHFKLGEIPYEGIREIPCDPKLARIALSWSSGETAVHQGRILTGDRFLADKSSHSSLIEELGGDAVEMEGAGVGIVSHVNRVPFLLIRVISDKADGEVPINFKAFLRGASITLFDVVCHLLSHCK